jgi:hypothetical protein
MTDNQLAFDQTLDDAIEVADEYLSRDEIIAGLEVKLAELRKDRLDG